MMRNLSLKFIYSSAKNVLSPSPSHSAIRLLSNVPVPVSNRESQAKSAFLMKIAGMSRKKALSAVLSQDKFRLISLDLMKQSFDILKTTGYHSKIEDHPELLCVNPAIIKNRILLMEEFGFDKEKIPKLILHFDSLPSKKLFALRSSNIIPKKENIIVNFFHICNIPLIENTIELDNSNNFREIYYKFFKFYVQRELGLSDEQVKEIFTRGKWLSFRYLKYNIRLIRHVFQIRSNEIQVLKYLLQADPNSIIHLFNATKNINIIKTMIERNPKMVALPLETIARNSRFLQEKNVPLEAPTYASLLTKSEMNFDRLSKLVETYQLQDFTKHPRLLYLIQHFNVVHKRLEILKQLNMRCYTLNQLTAPKELFAKHVSNGIDKVRNNDKFTLLSRELPYTRSELKKRLLMNPYAGYIPLYIVTETFNYLKITGFSAEDIFISLPLVLYHQKVVENAVVKSVPDLLKSMNHPDDYDMIKFKPYLPLALYCIEKYHNFTGDGVWTQENRSKEVDLFIE